jgi:hypothetical protein
MCQDADPCSSVRRRATPQAAGEQTMQIDLLGRADQRRRRQTLRLLDEVCVTTGIVGDAFVRRRVTETEKQQVCLLGMIVLFARYPSK